MLSRFRQHALGLRLAKALARVLRPKWRLGAWAVATPGGTFADLHDGAGSPATREHAAGGGTTVRDVTDSMPKPGPRHSD
jgi:hypothetical protein